MRTRIRIGLAAGGALSAAACLFGASYGSSKVVSESRDVSGFDRVSLDGAGEVIITQTGEESLTVETDGETMRHVITEVRGRTLHLGLDHTWFSAIRPSRPKFTVSLRDVAGLKISGSGRISSTRIEAGDLDLQIAGSGHVALESLSARRLSTRVSGSGSVTLSGEVGEHAIDVGGSGAIKAGDLCSDSTEVDVGGSGDVRVWATQSLGVRLRGSGSVSYYGTPGTSLSGSGSGSITSMGDK